MLKNKMQFKIEDWDAKGKPFKILIRNLDDAIELMEKIGLDFDKDKMGWWLKVNYSFLNSKEKDSEQEKK